MRSASRTAAIAVLVLILLLVGGCLASAAIDAAQHVGEQYRNRRADAGLGVVGAQRHQAEPGHGGEGQDGGCGHRPFFALRSLSTPLNEVES